MSSNLSQNDDILGNANNDLGPIHNTHFSCGVCNKKINNKAVFCDQCKKWIHSKCNTISDSEYKILVEEPDEKQWKCLDCLTLNNSQIFPFTLVNDTVFFGLNEIEMPSITDSLPSFEILSKVSNLPNLSDYDTDENINSNITSEYASVKDIASMELSDKDFALFHMNIRSHSLHFDEFHALLSSLSINFQVIGLSEIKVTSDVQVKANIELPGYNFHYTPSYSSAGGVGIYVRSNLEANKRDDLCVRDADFETVWVEICNPKAKNVICCCVYRHPNSDISKFNDHLHGKIEDLAKENKLIAIMGDFNIDLLKYDCHSATNEFVNMMFSHHFQPAILHPTRITDTSSTIIDNIYVNNATESNIYGGNILSCISDHLPQFTVLYNNAPEYKTSSFHVYDYKNLNEENFISDYKDVERSYLNDKEIDINRKFETFLYKLHNLVDKHCPKKKLSKKALKLRSKPWINRHIQKMMRIRDKLFRQFKLTKSTSDLNAYKKFRNRIVNEIKESKKNYYHQYFDEHKGNMKMLWQGIKNIISLKHGNVETISCLKDENDTKTSDPAKMAEEFNNYFTTVACGITQKIPRTPKSPLDYLSNLNLNSFFISPCTASEVSSLIRSLKLGKSSGPNSIPVKLLKILEEPISNDLSVLINESFVSGIFPDNLKIAKVVPIFKKGLTTLKSNYRPISLLSIFSKIFEKVMHQRMYKFLETYEILFCMQFGFRTGHSTDHALISLTETIKSSLDKGRVGCGIFIDLQKAFDTVNHDILLKKLEHYGIRGIALNWFKSYLKNRKQYVSLNGHSSSFREISCGVPQGSVLGPLLFLIYINDLTNSSKFFSFFLFADDTNIYCESDDPALLTRKVNRELKKVKLWLDSNKLALNISKTNYVLFHSPRKELANDLNIKIGKQNIQKTKYVKFLGVLMDEHLTWKYHTSELC